MDFVDFYRLMGLALLVTLVLGTRRAFTLTFLACANFALYAFLKPVLVSEYFQSGTHVPQYVIGAFCVFLLGTLLGTLLCDRQPALPPPDVVVKMRNFYLPALAGAGFDEENITRIVGIVAEMMSSDLMLIFGIVFLFSLGVLYKLIDSRVRMTRGRLFLYARILPAAGGLPLLGGWNTIYMSSFALNLLMSALIVRLYEKSFPFPPADR